MTTMCVCVCPPLPVFLLMWRVKMCRVLSVFVVPLFFVFLLFRTVVCLLLTWCVCVCFSAFDGAIYMLFFRISETGLALRCVTAWREISRATFSRGGNGARFFCLPTVRNASFCFRRALVIVQQFSCCSAAESTTVLRPTPTVRRLPPIAVL